MADMTIDQQRAVAMANARMRMTATPNEESFRAPAVDVSPDSIPQRSLAQKIVYPVLETGLMTGGSIIGGLGGTVVGGPIVGTSVGGAAGAGLGYGAAKEIEKLWDQKAGQRAPAGTMAELSDAASNVLTGALYEIGGRLILAPAAKAAGWLWDRATGKLVQIKAGKIVQELAGPNIEAVKAAAKTAPKDMTAAQAIADLPVTTDPLQALGVHVAKRDRFMYGPIEEAQQSAREAALKAVTPSKVAAETARTAASEPLYKEASEAVVAIDPQLKAILGRLPEGTIEAARKLAKLEGRPFTFGEAVPGVEMATRVGGTPQITGESLHYIKRALSDIANSQATKNIGKDVQRATQNVLNEYLSAVEARVPSYGQAREAFRAGSEPVNQAVVLNKMRELLSTPEGRESAKPFLNALGKGEQALLKKATGYARYEAGDLEKILTPEQMKTVTDIADQLTRNAKIAEKATAGAAQAKNIIEKNLIGYEIPNILDPKVAVTNRVINILHNRVNRKTMDLLTKSMASGESLAKLLDTLPAEQRNIILKTFATDPRAASIIAPGVNALVNQQNQNALAQ